MKIEFKKVSDFRRGILFELLRDAYSFDDRCEKCWISEWKSFDDFFFDNLWLADKCGFITTLNGEAIGMLSWDPRYLPEYAQIADNCIIPRYKGNGYGKMQLREAVNRILKYNPKRIIVTTGGILIPAQRMYKSLGFEEYGRRRNRSESSFVGDFIDYRMIIEDVAQNRIYQVRQSGAQT